jgi:hypothetical protein
MNVHAPPESHECKTCRQKWAEFGQFADIITKMKVNSTASVYTYTQFKKIQTWTRLMAWVSMAGLSNGSMMKTCLAALSVSPAAPDLTLIKNTVQSGSFRND